MLGAVKTFSQGAAQADDITLLILRYKAVAITAPQAGGRMQIEQRVNGDVAIIAIVGDITLSKGGDVLLKDKVQSLLQQGHRKLLLDMGRVCMWTAPAWASRSGLCDDEPSRRIAEAVESDQAPQRSAGFDKAVDGVRRLRRRGGRRGEFQQEIGIRRFPLIERVRNGEREGRDDGVEALAVGRHHLVAALH